MRLRPAEIIGMVLAIVLLTVAVALGFAATEETVTAVYEHDGNQFATCEEATQSGRDQAEATQGATIVNCNETIDIVWVPDPPTPEIPPFGTCVEIIGFSQTGQWANWVDAIEFNQRTFSAAGIDNVWANPNSSRWTQGLGGNRGCEDNNNSPADMSEVTDIVLNVSSRTLTTEADFEHYTRLAVQNALDGRRPLLQNIFLQPVVGPPEGETCAQGTRAQNNFPHIQAALSTVASEFGNVYHVHNPRIGDCAHYTDGPGHISTAGGQFVANAWEIAYGL